MKRRLYFVLPDVDHAKRVVDDLLSLGISEKHIHSTARIDVRIASLPRASKRQHSDLLHRSERWIWKSDLLLFFAALLALLLTLFNGYSSWSIVFLIIVSITFIGGMLWTRVPNVALNEFRNAIDQGEIVLMVDVPKDRIPEIEDAVHRHHPEATLGGVSWTVDALEL